MFTGLTRTNTFTLRVVHQQNLILSLSLHCSPCKVETPIAYQLQTPQKKSLQISQTESAPAAHTTAETSIVPEDTYRPRLTPEYPQATKAVDLLDLPETFSPLLEALSMPSPVGPVSRSPVLHSDIADLMKSCEAVTPLGKEAPLLLQVQ